MRYLVDTNIIIFALKDTVGTAALRLKETPLREQVVCSVVEAELYHGATKYEHQAKRENILRGFLAPYASVPFDSSCVPHYARIRDDLERRGNIIGGNDLLIAAIALAHDLTIITHNSREFARVPGLRFEDWAA